MLFVIEINFFFGIKLYLLYLFVFIFYVDEVKVFKKLINVNKIIFVSIKLKLRYLNFFYNILFYRVVDYIINGVWYVFCGDYGVGIVNIFL